MAPRSTLIAAASSAKPAHRAVCSRHPSLAKRRARLRKKSGGAIIFIVAMTLTVLATLGIYAMKATTTEIKSAGFERQNAQTQYLAEYGILSAATEISGPKAQIFVGLMNESTTRDTGCLSLAGVPSTANGNSLACRRIGSGELGANWSAAVLEPPGGSTTPSLGPIYQRGDFFVELTDPAQTKPPPGFDLKLGLCFAEFTVTATGMTIPTNAATHVTKSTGLMAARGRIVGGPVRCPN